jgi:myo-inositol-1(or 4)-monophosphatase
VPRVSGLNTYLTTAVDQALVLLAPDDGTGRRYKTDRDFATATDDAIEDHLRSLLARLAPHIGFLGEERGHTGAHDAFWCLDPIDGTVNYSRGIPTFGVSLALVEGGRPTLGQIALPRLGQRFVVDQDQVTCNDETIHVSECTSLTDAVVSVGDFATGHGARYKNARRIAAMNALADQVQRVRMFGSAATDLAWVASGRTDAVVIHGGSPWDVAAGVAIARAAGATVTTIKGTPYELGSASLLAASPAVHADLVNLLSTIDADQ